MTTMTIGRPVQPSLIRQLCEAWALADPRCGFEAHNDITKGHSCPHCHLTLWDYIRQMQRLEWPS